jgi:hypothetical protein
MRNIVALLSDSALRDRRDGLRKLQLRLLLDLGHGVDCGVYRDGRRGAVCAIR